MDARLFGLERRPIYIQFHLNIFLGPSLLFAEISQNSRKSCFDSNLSSFSKTSISLNIVDMDAKPFGLEIRLICIQFHVKIFLRHSIYFG